MTEDKMGEGDVDQGIETFSYKYKFWGPNVQHGNYSY